MKDFLTPWKDKQKENPPKREDFLKKALQDCQQSMEDAYRGLQNTNEPDLIDRYIYELNAANMRYKVLLRDIRQVSQEVSVPHLPVSSVIPPQVSATSEPIPVSAKSLSVSTNISSTNREVDTSLLNRSFR